MLSEPHSWDEEGATKTLFFSEKAWQKVQSRLSELVGANVHFIPPIKTFKCFSASPYPSCSDLIGANRSEASRCLSQAFKFGTLQHENIITCVHRLQYAFTRVQISAQFTGTILIGPVLLGRREPPDSYGKMCEELGLEKEQFLDRVRELRLFSFSGIHSILDCLEEVIKYVIRLNSHSEISK